MDRAKYFGLVSALRSLAAKINEKAAAEKTGISLQSGMGWPDPNQYYGRTSSGFFLAVDAYPSELHTPFGKVMLYGGGGYGGGQGTAPISWVFKEFRKHMKLEFVKNVCEKKTRSCVLYYSDVVEFRDEYGLCVDEGTLDAFRGTDKLVSANYCGCSSIYKIVALGDVVLPDASYEGPRMTPEEAKAAWEACLRNP
jgi:hypothetical protein